MMINYPVSYFLNEHLHFIMLSVFSLPLSLQIEISVKNQNRTAISVDPGETAHYELSNEGLHCFHRHPVWSTKMRG